MTQPKKVKEPVKLLPDAVRNTPKVVISSAEVERTLVGYLRALRGQRQKDLHAFCDGDFKDVRDLIHSLYQVTEEWINEMDEEDL